MEFAKHYKSLLREYLETQKEGVLLELSDFAAKNCIKNQIAPDVITDLHNCVVRDKLNGDSPQSIKKIIFQADEALLEVMSRYSSVFFEHLAQIEAEKEKEKALSKEIKKTSKKLERLHKVADSLAKCNHQEEVYQITVETAERVLGFSFCILHLLEDGKLVVKKASSKLPPDSIKEMHLDEDGLAAKTFRTGKSILFDHIDEIQASTSAGQDLDSGISLPLGKIGVFQVASTEKEHAFSQDDVQLLELLVEHTVGAIQRIHLERELKEQAIRDPLTDLHNRRYFNQIIAKEVERAKRGHYPLAFLMMDVNRFKEINDRYSHLVGDQVLKEVACLLQENTRVGDTVFRYGGDEFLVLLSENKGAVRKIKRRLQKQLKSWNEENGLLDFPLTLAMGISYWSPEDAQTIEEVLREADQRMYEEKGKRSS